MFSTYISVCVRRICTCVCMCVWPRMRMRMCVFVAFMVSTNFYVNIEECEWMLTLHCSINILYLCIDKYANSFMLSDFHSCSSGPCKSIGTHLLFGWVFLCIYASITLCVSKQIEKYIIWSCAIMNKSKKKHSLIVLTFNSGLLRHHQTYARLIVIGWCKSYCRIKLLNGKYNTKSWFCFNCSTVSIKKL